MDLKIVYQQAFDQTRESHVPQPRLTYDLGRLSMTKNDLELTYNGPKLIYIDLG